MAQQPGDQRTDILSADMKTLQERFDKLSDKLNDTQREVVQLRAELSGQGTRLSDTNGRFADINLWLDGFGIFITVLVAVASVAGFVQAGRKARVEARDWIEKNSEKLRGTIDAMEVKAVTITARMENRAQDVDQHAEDTKRRLDAMASRPLDKDKPLNEAERVELRQAEVEVKDKPESHYTARDWNIRAHAAYAAGNLDYAASCFGKVAESPDASAIDIAIALFNKGVVFGEMGRPEDEVAVYDEVVTRFGAASEVVLREQVAKALFNKGVAQGEMGRPEEAVAVYDEVVTRFGAASEVVLREQVAKALFNKGVRLGQLERSEEAVAVYDEVVMRFGSVSEVVLREQVAKALVNKGVRLGQMGRFKEEVAVYDEVVTRFGTASEPVLREQVATALFNKGVALGQLERSEEEVAVYDEVVTRFGAASELVLRERVAKALFNKGMALGQLERSEEAVAVYDEVVTRFGAASELVLRERVAKALFNKGVRLGQMDRPEEAVAAYDEVVMRFGAASEPALRELVAGAIGNRAWVSYQKGDDAALLVDSERALETLPKDNWLLCNRAFALHLLGRSRAEVMAAYALAWQAVNDKARWRDMAIKDLQEHPRKRPGAEPVPADLIAAVAALAEKKE